MGLFDWLTGSKPAPEVATRQPAKKLRAELMSVNGKELPFQIRDGRDEGVDLIAEWKIVDAQWYEFFAKAGLERVFRIMMKFDADSHEVRAMDEEWEVEWRAGEPVLFLRAEAFRGVKWEKSFKKTWAFRSDGSFGKVVDYRFDTSEMKAPLIAAAHRAGWGWRGVAFGKP